MGAEVSPTENDVLPKIMDMFAQFPPHPKLRYAATLVIGRYTEWTYEHPQYVQFQLSYIADGFKIREVAAASAQSLKYLCQDCAKFMADHWAELLEFFNEVASSGTLDDNDIIEFSEALAHVANGIPDQNTAEALQSFCLPVGNQLAAMLQAPELSENERRQVSLLLDRLGVFLRYVHIDDNETAEAWTGKIIADSWQVLSVAFQRFGGDAYISESICKFVRVLVEFYPTVVRPVIGQIVDAVVQAFQQTASTAYL
ncbi:Nuclear import receptor, partial [Linderina pennispora]